jgi:hypothetical protein
MLSDISLSDLNIQLAPISGPVPFIPTVHGFSAGLSAEAFAKIVQTGMALVQSRLPVEAHYVGARLTETGAEVTARVKKSVLKAEIRARLEVSTPTPHSIRIRFGEIAGPAWVPAGMVIEKAIEKASAQPGVRRAADDPRAVDLDPQAILRAMHVPAAFAENGAWTIAPSPEAVHVSFSTENSPESR